MGLKTREEYTKEFLISGGETHRISDVPMLVKHWWYNTRTKSVGGLRLTTEGFSYLINKSKIPYYHHPFGYANYNSYVLIKLDQYITSPYYLTNFDIVVIDNSLHSQLTLCDNDLRIYLRGKLPKGFHKKL